MYERRLSCFSSFLLGHILLNINVFFQIKAESSRRTLISSTIAPHVKCYSDRRNRLDGIGLSAGRSLTSIGMISLSLCELVIKADLKWSYSIVHRVRDQRDQMNTFLDRTRVVQRTLCLIIVCIAMFMTSPSTFWSFFQRKTSDGMQIFSLSEWTRGHCSRVARDKIASLLEDWFWSSISFNVIISICYNHRILLSCMTFHILLIIIIMMSVWTFSNSSFHSCFLCSIPLDICFPIAFLSFFNDAKIT